MQYRHLRASLLLIPLASVVVIWSVGVLFERPATNERAILSQSRLEDPGAYTNGRPDPRTSGSANMTSPQNQEAAYKAAEDAEAYKWHFNHQSEDNPPEMAIGSDTDAQNYIHYRFFEKTDRCILVRRR